MSSVSTRAFYGAFTAGQAEAGGGAAMPMFDMTGNGTSPISLLSALKAKGARAILKFVGSPNNHSDASSNFSLAMWKSRMDLVFAQTNPQQIGNFFLDGTLLANNMLDDVNGSVFAVDPTFEEFEACAEYSKSVWTMVPCTIRVHNQYLKEVCLAAGASHYTHVDFGWAQWADRRGPAMTWFTNHVNDGRSVKLGAICGFNLQNGGSGDTAPWNAHPGRATLFGMSPQEIDACGAAFSALTTMIGTVVYAQNPVYDSIDYYHWESIQTALTALANRHIGRAMGPINYRDISGSTSGSTATVIGSWALVQVAGHKRASDGASLSVPMADTPVAGNVLLLQTYSRDNTLRSSETPSGWTQAQRIGGTAEQGGELVLYVKNPAEGNEGAQTVTFSGDGGTGAIMGTLMEFSGNTSGTVISTVGSARSWSAGTSNMGPVPGVTSTVSDALVLVCAAKANDFTAENLPASTVMSGTTSGGETWNRAFISGTAAGNDAGMFCDYAALSGIASIATKSWTQTTQSDSGSSGAGCGFMVTLRPAAVTAGEPPVIEDLQDLTFSVSSTVSFVPNATGTATITWSKVSGPSNVTLDTTTGRFQWSPAATGTYVHVLGATNDFGSAEETFTVVVVAGDNDPPTVTHPGDKTVVAQDRLSFIIAAVDPEGDAITYGLDNPPEGALVVEDSGHFVWTPTGAQGPGTYPIVVLVSDGQHESRSTFTVTVQDTDWTRQVTSPTNQFRRL